VQLFLVLVIEAKQIDHEQEHEHDYGGKIAGGD
jgi:hypothetical protein